MNAALLAIATFALFAIGYRFYSRFLARHIFETAEDDSVTPAFELEDGVDYVPTNKHVLLGHHFTSIAGAAPIIGPAVACVHGWGPALMWIVLGVVFIGVNDDGSCANIQITDQLLLSLASMRGD